MPTMTAKKEVWVELIAPVLGQQTAQINHTSRSAMRVIADTKLPSENDYGGMVLSFFGIRSTELVLEDGEGLYIRAVRLPGSVSASVFSTLLVADSSAQSTPSPNLGWQEYADSTYTEQAPFSSPKNSDVILPNDGLDGPKQYGPRGLDLMSGGKIWGQEGDNLLITLSMTVARQTNTGEFDLELWWDIGGTEGEVFRQYHRIRGDVPRPILSTTLVHNTATWGANGATTYLRSNYDLFIYDIRTVVSRVFTLDTG